jgi:hypothetical protein
MQRNISILKILSIITLLSGCMDKELNGEVFIVTNSGQSVKLGLVEVIAIKEDDINKCKNDKKTEWVNKSQEVARQYASSEQEYDLSNALLKSQAVLLAVTGTKGYKEEAKQLEIYEKNQPNIKAAFQKVKSEYDNFRKGGFLPDCTTNNILAKSTTNADGKFTMKVPNEKIAIFASSKRKIFDETEEYYWLNWVEKDENNIIISNNNTYETSCPSCIVKLSELTN